MVCSGSKYGDVELPRTKERLSRSGSGVSTQAIVFSVVGISILGVLFFLLMKAKTLSHKQSRAPLTRTLRLNETVTVADELKITLNTIKLRADKYKVSATVFLGGEMIKIINAEDGCEVTYPKEHGYRIALIKSEADSATFSIVKGP